MGRTSSLDWLKLILAFMVVGIHTNFAFDLDSSLNYFLVDGLFRLAVPTFLLISGYFFYSASLEKKSAHGWIKKISILYLIWSIIYIPFWVDLDIGIEGLIFKSVFYLSFGYYHLWYMPALIVSSLFVMYFGRGVSWHLAGIIVLSTYFFGVLVQYIGNYHVLDGVLDSFSNKNWVHRNGIFIGIPMFFIGYLLKKHEQVLLSGKKLSFSLFISMLIYCAEICINYTSEYRDGGFDNYASLILVCPLLFLWVKGFFISGDFAWLSKSSAFIYFFHPVAILLVSHVTSFSSVNLTLASMAISVSVSYFVVRKGSRLGFLIG